MRILFLSSIYPQPGGPTRGVYCRHWCRTLAARHEVQVIAPWLWTDKLRWLWKGGLAAGGSRAELDGIEIDYPCYYYTPKVFRNAYGKFMWLSARRRIRERVAAFEPDCVVGYWAHPDGEVAVRAARLAGVPAAVIVGGSDALLLTHERGRRRQVVRVLEQADAVITVSQALKEKVVELGIDAEKTHVVYQGVDVERFTPGNRGDARRRLRISAEGPMLLWVGHLVPVKAVDVLLDACARLRQRIPNFRLYLVGDGPLRRPLEARSSALGLTDAVSFVGARLYEQLPDWYRAADLTVLPSWSEGLPNVLRESLACGTPFVASRVGSIPEIASEGANFLVPPGDASGFAEAFAKALTSTQHSGPSRYRPFSWEQSAEALLDVLWPLVWASRHDGPREPRSLDLPTLTRTLAFL